MLTKTRTNQTSEDLGKCICVSFPLHEIDLIQELDQLADDQFISRSQYIRRMIREKKQINQDQSNSHKERAFS